jgi:hypothetical protein
LSVALEEFYSHAHSNLGFFEVKGFISVRLCDGSDLIFLFLIISFGHVFNDGKRYQKKEVENEGGKYSLTCI